MKVKVWKHIQNTFVREKSKPKSEVVLYETNNDKGTITKTKQNTRAMI